MSDLNLDVSAEEARALHRIVRSMHDGHCPACSLIGPAEAFEGPLGSHICPGCEFSISGAEAGAALAAFRPYLQRSLAVFEKWRDVSSTET